MEPEYLLFITTFANSEEAPWKQTPVANGREKTVFDLFSHHSKGDCVYGILVVFAAPSSMHP